MTLTPKTKSNPSFVKSFFDFVGGERIPALLNKMSSLPLPASGLAPALSHSIDKNSSTHVFIERREARSSLRSVRRPDPPTGISDSNSDMRANEASEVGSSREVMYTFAFFFKSTYTAPNKSQIKVPGRRDTP